MCGDPILLRIFARSMGFDGILMGLPFFVASVCIALTFNQDRASYPFSLANYWLLLVRLRHSCYSVAIREVEIVSPKGVSSA